MSIMLFRINSEFENCILHFTRLKDTTLESLTENKLDCNHIDGTGDAWRIWDESCTYLKHQVYRNYIEIIVLFEGK